MFPTRVGVKYAPPTLGIEFRDGENGELQWEEMSFEQLETEFEFSATKLQTSSSIFGLIELEQLEGMIKKLKEAVGVEEQEEQEEEQEQEEEEQDSYNEEAFEFEEEELGDSYSFDDIEEESDFETFEEQSQDSDNFF